MKSLIAAVVAVSGVILLSGCATMNEDQCLVGDWGGQGWRDGAAGARSAAWTITPRPAPNTGWRRT